MRVHIEGYGCSTSAAFTEQISALLSQNGFELCSHAGKADVLLINTCAVKQPTENRMIRRIRQLHSISKSTGARIIVCGCLPKINAAAVSDAPSTALGTSLGEVAEHFGIDMCGAGPLDFRLASNPTVSIIPIASGCLGRCTFCCVRRARGRLKSTPLREISQRFKRDLSSGTREFWLTAQDTAAYGKDCGNSLPELLNELISTDGNYRIRIGMMNPDNLFPIKRQIALLLKTESRLYKFLHVPLQSGSDRMLALMARNYTAQDFISLAKWLRSEIPDLTISTDIIVGFPSETDSDFKKTCSALQKIQPDITNVSRFGARPGTAAASMPGQVSGAVKKQRSRILSELCSGFSHARTKLLVGTTQSVLFTEQGSKGLGELTGRTQNYKTVAVQSAAIGSFSDVLITSAAPTHLYGLLV